MQDIQLNCDVGRFDYSDAFMGGNCLLLNDFNRPILKLKCNWTQNLFIMIIYKCMETDFEDNQLIVLGHSMSSVKIGEKMNLRSVLLNRFVKFVYALRLSLTNLIFLNSEFDLVSTSKLFYERAKFYSNKIKNDWKIYLTCLKSTENLEYLEEIYLHLNLNRTINLKLGYLGIFSL